MRIFSNLVLLTLIAGYSSNSHSALLDFNDANSLGVTLGGDMKWSDIGGGHLYNDDYNSDDFIYFSTATYVNSFEMNAMAWQGFDKGAIGSIDIEAYNITGDTIWSTTVNLSDYTAWDNWLTVSVEMADINQLAFLAPGTLPHINGFWPSVDNMVINQPVPVPAAVWLFASGLLLLGSKALRR